MYRYWGQWSIHEEMTWANSKMPGMLLTGSRWRLLGLLAPPLTFSCSMIDHSVHSQKLGKALGMIPPFALHSMAPGHYGAVILLSNELSTICLGFSFRSLLAESLPRYAYYFDSGGSLDTSVLAQLRGSLIY